MATRGFLIRFIDIGLIVLFGFLMISDIEASTRVELAGVTDETTETTEPDDPPVVVVIEVRADGAFGVYERLPSPAGTEAGSAVDVAEVPAETAPADGAGPEVVTDATRALLAADVEALVAALRALADAHRATGSELLVVIEPHPASAVQGTVDAMDAADRVGLDKSLRMDIEVGR